MSEQIVKYDRPDPVALAQQTGAVLEFVQTLEIDAPEVYTLAGDELKSIKAQTQALDAKRREIVDPLNKAVKAVNDLFRAPLDTLSNSERVIKHKMLTYSTEQERIAAEEQRKAEDAARQERERLAHEAAEREAAARVEAQRLEAEAAEQAAAGNTAAAEALQQQATEAEIAGQDQALALNQAAQVVSAPAVVVPMVKAAGTAIRETYKAEVTDKTALVAHIAAHPHLLELVTINQTALNAQARALKDGLNYPGVRVIREKSMSSRAA